MVSPAAGPRRVRRPITVWVIFISEIVSMIFVLTALGLAVSGRLPMNPAEEEYFAKLTIFDHLSTVLLTVLNALAAIQLFRLRRSAVALFAWALALNLMLTVRAMFGTNWIEAVTQIGGISTLIGFAAAASIVWYSVRLDRKGILS